MLPELHRRPDPADADVIGSSKVWAGEASQRHH